MSEQLELENFLPQQVIAAAGRVKNFLAGEIAEKLDLSLAEWRVVVVVGMRGIASASEVVDRSDMDKVKVSRASSTLIARGIISQESDPHDGRARVMRLTRKGARTYQDAVAIGRRIEEQIGDGWDGLRRGLARLDSLVDVDEGAEGEE